MLLFTSRLISGLALIILLLLSFFSPIQAGVTEDLESAFRAHRNGDYDQAINLYTQILKNRSLEGQNRSIAFFLRAEAYREKGSFPEALADYNRAIKLKPNYHQAIYGRALTLEKQGQIAEAFQEVNKALTYQSDNQTYQKKAEKLKQKLAVQAQGIQTPGK